LHDLEGVEVGDGC